MLLFLHLYEQTGNTQNTCCCLLLQVELLFFPFYLFIATEIAFSCEIEAVFSFSASHSGRQARGKQWNPADGNRSQRIFSDPFKFKLGSVSNQELTLRYYYQEWQLIGELWAYYTSWGILLYFVTVYGRGILELGIQVSHGIVFHYTL